jgi:hypothetical protein
MKVWLRKVFFAWSQTANVLCTEVHKQRENVSGGERVDARRNYTMSKIIMLFVCGCYESELCLNVIRVYSFRRFFLKRKQTGINIPEFVKQKLLFATVGLMITP